MAYGTLQLVAVVDPFTGINHLSRIYGVDSGLTYHVTHCAKVFYNAQVLDVGESIPATEGRCCKECQEWDNYLDQLLNMEKTKNEKAHPHRP